MPPYAYVICPGVPDYPQEIQTTSMSEPNHLVVWTQMHVHGGTFLIMLASIQLALSTMLAQCKQSHSATAEKTADITTDGNLAQVVIL